MIMPDDFGRERKRDSEPKSQLLLRLLQEGPRLTSELKEVDHRFSACIRTLRERGYQIDGCELENADWEWRLVGYSPRVKVTDEMKAAYYASEHWKAKRADRLRYDNHKCVLCRFGFNLQVHHWRYELFNERLEDLCSLCEPCHEDIHSNAHITIHFPHYVTPEIAALLTTTN